MPAELFRQPITQKLNSVCCSAFCYSPDCGSAKSGPPVVRYRFGKRDRMGYAEKGGSLQDVRMRDDLRIRMATHGPQDRHRRVFRFHQVGNLKHKLMRAKLSYLGLPCPTRRPTGWTQPPTDWRGKTSIPSDTLLRRGCVVQALTFRDLSPPATGATQDPPLVTRTSYRGRSGNASRIFPAWKRRGKRLNAALTR